MCENSIDAGAKNITVEIKNGGISLIKIVDDGCGISEDDMEIAFERHATSKIRSAEDLNKVSTMGFRGEALASIAAIANVEMISKRPEDEIGHRIVVEGGKVLEKGECGAPNGTSITVKNLFFNTPVRYKFLKKDFTESGYVEDVITQLALINTDVAIKLVNSGKTVIQTTGNGDIRAVVYSVYGKDTANGIYDVDYTYEDIKVTGVVGNASTARSNRNGQIFFVNKRFVKDKTLSSSVDQAYKDILPIGKYGFVILNLEMDMSKVDCNVHPAKLEVRFQEEQNVFKAVYHAIKSRNEDIMPQSRKMPEIENQEKLESNEEETQDDIKDEEEIEKEEFKPREGTFSGFFKMFKKEEKNDEEGNTLIEELYAAKQKGDWDNLEKAESKKVEDKKIEDKIIKDIEKETEKEIEEVIRKVENNNASQESINRIEAKEPEEVKLGNTIISSNTMESNYSVKDLIKAANLSQETMILDSTKVLSADDSKTEIIDSLKKIDADNSRETVIINTEEVRNEKIEESEVIKEFEKSETDSLDQDTDSVIEENKNTIAEKIIEQKVKSDMDDTQFVDTGKVRKELRRNASEEDDVPVSKDFANMYKKVFGMDVSTVRKTREEENAKLDFSKDLQVAEKIDNETVFEDKKEETSSEEEVPAIKYRFIGTIFDSYAIIEIKDEMYMIEKNAAEERLMYEVVKANYYNDEIDDSVALLLADIVTLSPKEMSIARDLKGMFKKTGFDYDEFGESTLKLTKVPSWAENLNTKKLFLEILREMDKVAVTATKEKEEKFIWTVSNKFVLSSDTKLTDQELEDLIKRLLKLESPFMYPDGRLIAVKVTKANMEKKFSRR